MSTSREVTVWCDEPECTEWTYGAGSNHTVVEARKGARHEGWVYRNGKDLCPEHSPKEVVKRGTK